ncbi:AraC family transcriptional regulator [Mobilitalea sibirica]|uniref:AraC family transcriptional regulator n=1 Tax=Mobilitalea sibirica TaxID=1462919 RepID=A0A8J7L3A3_9FIRM|nr:AraC family transcriptional regulator [Mobilitalea sibirica]MBH1942143.1 AraC family transcriptional regulator [Mobilitalea sibirica]
MNYKEHIQKSIDFIEENLKYEIDLNAVAKASGYSSYHFLRVFKEVTHITPGDYIRKRRLTEIVKLMDRCKSISDIAFAYGFNSKENFTRAFKSEHHILPTEYKEYLNSLKLYERQNFILEAFHVEPSIIHLPSFSLTVFKSDESYPPNFWNKYNCKKLSKRLSGGNSCEDFGVSIWNNELNTLDYFIGIRTSDVAGNTEGTTQIQIPGGKYAHFKTPQTTHYNFVNVIHRTWEYINNTWLPESAYKRTGNYEFETYIEDSRNFSEDIYIPIVKR